MNRNITISNKLKILDYANKCNISQATIHFILPRTTISYWNKQEKDLSNFDNPNNKKLYIKVVKLNMKKQKKNFL